MDHPPQFLFLSITCLKKQYSVLHYFVVYERITVLEERKWRKFV